MKNTLIQPNTIFGRFAECMARQPDAISVAEDGRSVTYAELALLADRIMTRFYNEHYACVGIVMSHGIEMIAAMLAVLKSGAAYVPAEPSLPKARIDYMMRTAEVTAADKRRRRDTLSLYLQTARTRFHDLQHIRSK